MNPFELIKPTPYVSQHVGLPLEELKVAAQNVTQRKAENDAIIDDLELMMTNFGHVPEDVAGKKAIEDAKFNINKSLEELSKLEFGTVNPKARNILKNVLRENVLKNKDLNQTLQNYAVYQETQKKLDELRLSNKQILDLSTGPFSSFTEDADGNKTYNTYRNPYQVRHEDRTKVQEESIKAFLIEDYLKGEVNSPKTIEEYMKMPYDELIQVLGIDQTQIDDKLRYMQDRYLQTDQGRQEYDEYYSELRRNGKSDETAKQLAGNLVKENIRNRANGFAYNRKQVQFTKNETFDFSQNPYTGEGVSPGMYIGANVVAASIKENPKTVTEIVKNNYSIGTPEQEVKTSLITEAFTTDPEKITEFNEMYKAASKVIDKQINFYGKPLASYSVNGEFPTFDQLNKDFPQAYKAATVTGEFNPGIFYAMAQKEVSAGYDEIYDNESISSQIYGDLDYNSAALRKTKVFESFEEAINQFAESYYSDDLKREDDNTVISSMLTFDSTTDGKKMRESVTQAASDIGSSIDILSVVGLTSEAQKNLGEFTKHKITEVQSIGNFNGELAITAMVSGKFKDQDTTGNAEFPMVISLKDPNVIEKVLSSLPEKERWTLMALNTFGKYKLQYGKGYYLDGNGNKIDYPEGVRITNTPKGYALLNTKDGKLMELENSTKSLDGTSVGPHELYKLFAILDGNNWHIRALESNLESEFDLPKGYLGASAGSESTSDDDKNPFSSARGRHQFIDSTARMYGVDQSDPISSTVGAAKYAVDNRKVLRRNGVPTGGVDLYLSHIFDAAGYVDLYKNKNAPAVEILAQRHGENANKVLENNTGEYYKPDMTAGELIKIHADRFNRNLK